MCGRILSWRANNAWSFLYLVLNCPSYTFKSHAVRGCTTFHEFHQENTFSVPEYSSHILFAGEGLLEHFYLGEWECSHCLDYSYVSSVSKQIHVSSSVTILFKKFSPIMTNLRKFKAALICCVCDGRTASVESVLHRVSGTEVYHSRWYRLCNFGKRIAQHRNCETAILWNRLVNSVMKTIGWHSLPFLIACTMNVCASCFKLLHHCHTLLSFMKVGSYTLLILRWMSAALDTSECRNRMTAPL